METIIRKKLSDIEKRENVEIILAAEVGVRAWGLGTPNSDHCVRFIYKRNLNDYLRLDSMKDTIEWQLGNTLDIVGWDLKKASFINCIFVLVASMPCVLGYNLWDAVRLIGSRDVLDSEDFIVSNLLLPLGSLVYLLFCVSKWGWGYDKYLEEANTGTGFKMPKWLKPYFQFVLPVLIVIILVQGLL